MDANGEIQHRLRLVRLSNVPDAHWVIYEGLISLARNPINCFSANDSPVEFFLNVNKYTGDIEIKSKLPINKRQISTKAPFSRLS